MTTRIVGLASALALVAAACSDDGNDGSDDAAAPAEPKPVLYEGYTSDIYADPAHWVCRPDTDDLCDGGLDATVLEADGTLTEEPWEPAEDPPVDCFYVYPTISRDETTNSDLVPSEEEEGFATLNQVARLGEVCRVFAPVYRQTTLTALAAGLSGQGGGVSEESRAIAYNDVADAFKHYMANDNGGRGVVLVGHSQGSGLLNQLIQEEIDPDDDVRERLVSAYLAGWAVAVPDGEDVGGDFANVPLCRADDETGCVVTWASYRATSPPPENAFFGRAPDGDGVAGCNNPAGLDGGRVELHAYFPTNPSSGILGDLGATGVTGPWLDPEVGEVATPYVTVPGLVEGECASREGRNYLEVTVNGDPSDPRADDIRGDLTPEWGLHLIDVTLVMGDMVGLVAAQTAAYLADAD